MSNYESQYPVDQLEPTTSMYESYDSTFDPITWANGGDNHEDGSDVFASSDSTLTGMPTKTMYSPRAEDEQPLDPYNPDDYINNYNGESSSNAQTVAYNGGSPNTNIEPQVRSTSLAKMYSNSYYQMPAMQAMQANSAPTSLPPVMFNSSYQPPPPRPDRVSPSLSNPLNLTIDHKLLPPPVQQRQHSPGPQYLNMILHNFKDPAVALGVLDRVFGFFNHNVQMALERELNNQRLMAGRMRAKTFTETFSPENNYNFQTPMQSTNNFLGEAWSLASNKVYAALPNNSQAAAQSTVCSGFQANFPSPVRNGYPSAFSHLMPVIPQQLSKHSHVTAQSMVHHGYQANYVSPVRKIISSTLPYSVPVISDIFAIPHMPVIPERATTIVSVPTSITSSDTKAATEAEEVEQEAEEFPLEIESKAKPTAEPKAEPKAELELVNGRKPLNKRPLNIKYFDPTDYYDDLAFTPATWGSKNQFKYNQYGELHPGTYYSIQDIMEYITASNRPDPLTMWLQVIPADSSKRYGHPHSDKCRFEDCPDENHTIRTGQFRIAFDEHHKYGGGKRTTDPFHNAGYVHLFCMERFIDFPSVCRGRVVKVGDSEVKLVRADTRKLKEGKNKMALTRDHETMKDVADQFVAEALPWSYFDGVRASPDDEYYQHTLCYKLTSEHLAQQYEGLQGVRDGRGGNSIDKHMNNLNVYVAGRMEMKRGREAGKRPNVGTKRGTEKSKEKKVDERKAKKADKLEKKRKADQVENEFELDDNILERERSPSKKQKCR